MAYRVVLVVADQLVDRPVQGGREEEGLAGRAGPVDEAADHGEKAHVGHPVSLVDDHDVHVRQVDRAPLDQVGEPPRARDEHVDAAA